MYTLRVKFMRAIAYGASLQNKKLVLDHNRKDDYRDTAFEFHRENCGRPKRSDLWVSDFDYLDYIYYVIVDHCSALTSRFHLLRLTVCPRNSGLEKSDKIRKSPLL